MEPPAEAIERRRLDRGLTQAQACVLAGVPRATWSTIESGITANPHPDTKLRIAHALGCEVSAVWSPRGRHLLRLAPLLAEAREVERDGTPEERQRFGKRLCAVLARVDPELHRTGVGDPRYDEAWKLALSLARDVEKPPITVTGGQTVGRETDDLTPTTKARVVAAKRRRVQAQNARVKAHAAATAGAAPVSQRPRTRERRESTRRSTRGSPDSEGEDPEPALSRKHKRAAS
jgi:transcriptional regulator with XRE-family HTH domain